jgi:hypothetical protein
MNGSCRKVFRDYSLGPRYKAAATTTEAETTTRRARLASLGERLLTVDRDTFQRGAHVTL